VKSEPAVADAEEIEITPEMIGRGVRFCEESALGTLSNTLISPRFVEAFLVACLGLVAANVAASRGTRPIRGAFVAERVARGPITVIDAGAIERGPPSGR